MARLANRAPMPRGSDIVVKLIGDDGGHPGKYVTPEKVTGGTVLPAASVFDVDAVLGSAALGMGRLRRTPGVANHASQLRAVVAALAAIPEVRAAAGRIAGLAGG